MEEYNVILKCKDETKIELSNKDINELLIHLH